MKTKLKSILAVALCAVGLAAFAEPDAVQLWENGPYFATCNVGAKTPQEYGYYFWWGDTVGYTNSGSAWVSVIDNTKSIQFKNTAPANTLYGADAAALADYVDANRNLKSDYDAATAHLGAPWRMMTKDELDNLVNTEYCQRVWTNEYKGVTVSGYVVKGKAGSAYENNEVFFPADGYGYGSSLSQTGSLGRYWSSTPNLGESELAWNLSFESGIFNAPGNGRYFGSSVRAVRDTPPEPPAPEGSEGNPWKVGGTDGTGDLVEAWTNGTGVLTVQGAGSVTNLADVIADWAAVKGGITAINVTSNGVTGAMAQAFAGLGDPTPVALTLPDGWQGELPDGGNWYGAKVELRDGYPLTVRNVRARQRWPWNGRVDVLCDMTGPAGAKDAIVTVKDGEKALTNFTAEVTIPEGGVLATNFVWDAMTAGLAANFKSDDVTVEVAFAPPPAAVPTDADGFDTTAENVAPYYSTTFVPGDYCIVDLTTGKVTEEKNVMSAATFNTAEYKTTKMAFRWVPAGKFKSACAWSTGYKSLVTNNVTLSAYWMAVFPVTEAQFNAVMDGATTSVKPKVSITWNDFRGGTWDSWDGTYANVPVPGAGTFVSNLNAKVAAAGCADTFDLCTSFQWERAARAGTRTDYFFSDTTAASVGDGTGTFDSLKEYAWYLDNNSPSGAKDVGQVKPNAWGLYDVYGNKYDLCLDGNVSLNGVTPGTDYVSPLNAGNPRRVGRGGCYSDYASYCSSVYRSYRQPSQSSASMGFRLVRKPMAK